MPTPAEVAELTLQEARSRLRAAQAIKVSLMKEQNKLAVAYNQVTENLAKAQSEVGKLQRAAHEAEGKVIYERLEETKSKDFADNERREAFKAQVRAKNLYTVADNLILERGFRVSHSPDHSPDHSPRDDSPMD